MFISKLTEALNRYDQYGVLRVNALQTLMVAICLFLVNFIFSPPEMQQLMPMFLFAFIGSATVPNYNKRQSIVMIFCLLGGVYAILFNLVKEYNLGTVLMVGFALGCLFLAAKKYPILAGIAVTLHMLGTSVIKIKPAGNGYVYLNFMGLIGFYALLVVIFMNLFPRYYYYRIWLRAYGLTLSEFEARFRALAHGETDATQQPLKHFNSFCNFTQNLSFREQGFSARRININLLKLYGFLNISQSKLIACEVKTFNQLADSCKVLQQNLFSAGEPLAINYANIALPAKIAYSLRCLEQIGNQLCLKI